MTTMSERNPQKKINVLTSAGLSASLLGLYYSHADHLPGTRKIIPRVSAITGPLAQAADEARR